MTAPLPLPLPMPLPMPMPGADDGSGGGVCAVRVGKAVRVPKPNTPMSVIPMSVIPMSVIPMSVIPMPVPMPMPNGPTAQLSYFSQSGVPDRDQKMQVYQDGWTAVVFYDSPLVNYRKLFVVSESPAAHMLDNR